MPEDKAAQAEQIKRFLRSGDYDLIPSGWPGQNLVEQSQAACAALAAALLLELNRRTARVSVKRPVAVPPGDLESFTRAKVSPMVRGLFPRKEWESVLALLDRSVVFLTPENVEAFIRRESSLNTAWKIANIYLSSAGAKPLGGEEWLIVGMSEETTCYVSLEYFEEQDPFADFVVHEVAHVFHNTKRETAGLRQTRQREWLLPVSFRKRELFAYLCEAYSQILEKGKRPADRLALCAQLKRARPPPDERVDPEEYLDVLAEAVTRRNGWKVILRRCAAGRSQP